MQKQTNDEAAALVTALLKLPAAKAYPPWCDKVRLGGWVNFLIEPCVLASAVYIGGDKNHFWFSPLEKSGFQRILEVHKDQESARTGFGPRFSTITNGSNTDLLA